MANDSSAISLAIVNNKKFNEATVRLLLNETIMNAMNGIENCEIGICVEDSASYTIHTLIAALLIVEFSATYRI